jgi:hypothetical protein
MEESHDEVVKSGTAGNVDEKMMKLKEAIDLVTDFDDFLTENKWKEVFEVPMDAYLDQMADPNLKIFMGFNNMHDTTGISMKTNGSTGALNKVDSPVN